MLQFLMRTLSGIVRQVYRRTPIQQIATTDSSIRRMPYRGGDESVIWPAAFVRLVGCGPNVGLLWYLYRMDRQQ